MRLRKILLIFSLLTLCMNSYGNFNKKNVFIEWDSGKLDFVKDNINIFTKDSKNPTFLTLNISDKNLDLANENIIIDLLVDDIRATQGIEIRFMQERNSNNFLYYSLPFFGDYEFNLLKSSTRTKLGLGRANFTQKGKPITKINYMMIYFSSKSKNTRLSLWPIQKVEKKSNGILTLTFDDGAKDNLIAAKILKQYNIPATAYIMPNSLNTNGFLTSKELKYLSKQNWDIDCHHETPFTYFSEKLLQSEISSTQEFMKKNKYKQSNFHLAYPLGKTNELTIKTVSSMFATARIASGGIETIPPANLHMLRTFNVLKSTTPEELKEVIAKTKKNKQWLILMFHHIRNTAKIDIDYTEKNFREVAKIIHESGITTMTMDEVYLKYLK